MKRKIFVVSALGALAGCGSVGSALNNSAGVRRVLASAETLDYALIGGEYAAREYPRSAIAPVFRVNGFATPSDALYQALEVSDFTTYRLVVDGLVARPLSLSVASIARFPQQTQITRHDCVEGWSVIGQWSGVRLWNVVAAAMPMRGARYVLFHCMDRDDTGVPYYESVDMRQARHPQTLLATHLNGARLDPDHGAPVRLRVPTQLGYKSAKWVARVEIVGDLSRFGAGHGGYWEDQGYEWYAGI
ncbi:MAG: molybdopterin-dependent oxidoreductase [Candidatus Tyrphobacter sp.]